MIAQLYRMDEDSDNVPDEPMNHVAMANRAELIDKYSLDKHTGTLPAERVKIEEEGKRPLFKMKKQAQVKKNKDDIQTFQEIKNFNHVMKMYDAAEPSTQRKRAQTAVRKTPINAMKYFLREDLVNKNVIEKKSIIMDKLGYNHIPDKSQDMVTAKEVYENPVSAKNFPIQLSQSEANALAETLS